MRDFPQFPCGLLLIELRKKPWLVGLYTVGDYMAQLYDDYKKSLYQEPVQWKVGGG